MSSSAHSTATHRDSTTRSGGEHANATTSATKSSHDKRGWLEALARAGYASRGVIYLIIGGLALVSVFSGGGETTDSKGAISQVLGAPLGWLMVLAIALGLVGYCAWRLCQAIFDADGHGTEAKAMIIRGGLFCSAITHGLLAIWAGKLAIGEAASGGSSEGSKESLVATLMSQPFGLFLVGALGLILIGVGLAQFAKGQGEKFDKHFKWDPKERRAFVYFCKFGLYARGVIFAIVVGFVMYAAITTTPSHAGGLADALQWLRSQAFGPWLLGAISLGLICFGIYSLVEAVYRRVQIENS